MQRRVSLLNGRLENEVDDFVSTLLNEFGYDVRQITISYHDDELCEEVEHKFYISHTSSFLGREVSDELFR